MGAEGGKAEGGRLKARGARLSEQRAWGKEHRK